MRGFEARVHQIGAKTVEVVLTTLLAVLEGLPHAPIFRSCACRK